MGSKANKFAAFVAAAVFAGTGGAALAVSAPIEAAKAECRVGERLDGYLGVVAGQSVDADLKREIDAINLRRKAVYAQAAADAGATIEAAAATTAKRLIETAPSGNCVQNNQGAWVRIP